MDDRTIDDTGQSTASLSERADKDIASDEVPANQHKTAPSGSSTTSPIEIRQVAGGKFGVLHARHPSFSASDADKNREQIPIDRLLKTANTMSSMMMAHKIALEDDFRLEPGMNISGPLMSLSPIIGSSPSASNNGPAASGEPSLQSRVKDIVHEAYWDLFKEELDSQKCEKVDERCYEKSKQLLGEIRQKILELLFPQHSRLKQDIEDKLDPQIINQLSSCHSLDLLDYGKYILSVLARLCAPVRDDKLKELSELQDVTLLYRGIMDLLELMRLDFLNFTINRFKPHIKAHGQEYEREKFNEILKEQKNIGIDGLEYTRIWLKGAVEKLDCTQGIADLISCGQSTSSLCLEESLSEATNESAKTAKIVHCGIVDKVLNLAFLELLEWSPQVQKLYPETLLFDQATFKALGDQFKTLLLAASLLLTTFAFLKGFGLHEDNEFKVLIKSHIITLLTAQYDKSPAATGSNSDQVKLETITTRLCEDIKVKIESTDRRSKDLFEDQRKLLEQQILDLQSSSNRVRELVRRRILEFVETLLDLDVKHQQKKLPSRMPPPVNIPLGLNCLTDEITLTMAQLVKIVRYNRQVFYQHYESIIVDLVSNII